MVVVVLGVVCKGEGSLFTETVYPDNVCGHAYFIIKYCKTMKSFIIDKEYLL